MTDLAELSALVMAGIVSVRARTRGLTGEAKSKEEDRAMNDLYVALYQGYPGEAPGDQGDEMAGIAFWLDWFFNRRKV